LNYSWYFPFFQAFRLSCFGCFFVFKNGLPPLQQVTDHKFFQSFFSLRPELARKLKAVLAAIFWCNSW